MDAGYYSAYERLYGKSAKGELRGRFRRDLLPDPVAYFKEHLEDNIRKGSGWVDVRCPFHDDTHASLSVNLNHGGFFCHACGTSGGDVLDFHQRLTRQRFKEAAQELGAWK